jgi:membrane associated rhomboid family serine protease
MEASAPERTTCYRHKGRETGVACSSCGRPICPDCMTPTPVGMRCPECSRQKTKVRTAKTLTGTPYLTYGLIAVCAVVYIVQVVAAKNINGTAGTVFEHGALFAGVKGFGGVADGEVWRIVTAGFMHASPLHILLNMYILWWMGNLLEPAIGRLRFGLIYGVALVGGSLGALLISPNSATVGASGAIFGLMGAAIVVMRARGIDPMQSGIVLTLVLNLGFTFLYPGNISIGGHVGGVIAGGLAAYLLFYLGERRRLPAAATMGACGALGVGLFVAAVLVA